MSGRRLVCPSVSRLLFLSPTPSAWIGMRPPRRRSRRDHSKPAQANTMNGTTPLGRPTNQQTIRGLSNFSSSSLVVDLLESWGRARKAMPYLWLGAGRFNLKPGPELGTVIDSPGTKGRARSKQVAKQWPAAAPRRPLNRSQMMSPAPICVWPTGHRLRVHHQCH